MRYMSYSQRRFLGFRNRFEFDKKRLIFGSKKEFSVIGYDYEKRVYELLRQSVSFDEEICFLSFLEDHIPTFLFVILYSKREGRSSIKILKMKKNKKFDDNLRIEETKKEVADQIIQNINKGNFKKKRKKSYDNMELIPNKKLAISTNYEQNVYLKQRKSKLEYT